MCILVYDFVKSVCGLVLILLAYMMTWVDSFVRHKNWVENISFLQCILVKMIDTFLDICYFLHCTEVVEMMEWGCIYYDIISEKTQTSFTK